MSTRVALSMDKDWSFHLGDVDEPVEKTHSYIYNTSKAELVRVFRRRTLTQETGRRSMCLMTGRSVSLSQRTVLPTGDISREERRGTERCLQFRRSTGTRSLRSNLRGLPHMQSCILTDL